MYKSPREALKFLEVFTQGLPEPIGKEVVFFPPSVCLWVVQDFLKLTSYKVGSQNCYVKNEGAFTGETSPEVLFEMGCQYVLVGHSERRQIFLETDDFLALKFEAAQKVGLIPMLCVGETLEQREKGLTHDVVTSQLTSGLQKADFNKGFSIAYEPVWAIGTGKTASSDQANEVHGVIRKALTQLSGLEMSKKTSILYGGSVKPENAQDLANKPEIDGFLVGGASLEVDKFESLVRVNFSARS